MKPNRAITCDVPGEVQFDPKRFELNSHGGEAITGLNNGKGKFAAGKKRGLLPIQRHQVWLRQNLQDTLLLQCLNHSPEMNIEPEEKNIQYVVNGLIRRKWTSVCAGASGVTDFLLTEPSELSRRGRA